MKKVINKIFIYIFMLIIIFISVIPFVYMVMMSFKSTTNAYDFDFSLEKLTLMQYQKIFSLANFPNYVFNSVFVVHLFNHDNGRSVRGYYYSVIFDY